MSLDTCFYFWSNGSLQGGKFCFSSMSGGPSDTESIFIEDERNYAGARYNGIQIIDTPHGLGTTSCIDPGYTYCAQATFTPNIGAGTFALGYWSDGTNSGAPCYPSTTITVNAAGNWVVAPLPCGLIPPTCTIGGAHVETFDAAPLAAWTTRIPLAGPTFSSSAAPGCLELSVPGDQAYDAWTESGYQADNAPTLTRTDDDTAARSDWVATTRLTLSNAGSGSGGFHSSLVVRFSATKQIFWGLYQSGSNALILNLEESGQHNLAQVTGIGQTLILGLRYQYAGGLCRYSFGYQQPSDATFTTLTTGITDCSPTASMGLFTKTFAGGRAVTTDVDWFDLVTGPSTTNTLGPADATVMANTTCRTVRPVNCATGDFYHTFTDLSIPGRGLSLAVTRTYNSLAASQDGPFGYGWSSSDDMSLTTDSSGAVTVTQPGGSSVSFTETAPGVYQAPGRVLATLVSSTDGSTFTFTNHVQERYVFNAPSPGVAGTLRQEIDRNGYVTSFGYSGGNLTSVTDSAGHSLAVTYNAAGRIAQISDPIGRTVVYTYDAAGDLTAVQDVAGGITRFSYDPAGSHLLLTMTDPRGGVLTNQYDGSGRVVAQTDPLSRTTSFTYTVNPDLSQTTIITDPRGNVTVEQYQDNELLSLTTGFGTTQAATTTYTYDPATLGITSQTDPDGHTSRSAYDAQGNLLSRTDALGRTTSYAYDALNDVTAITNPLSLTTVMTYDAQGNLLQVARPLTQTGQTALTTLGYDPVHPGDVITQTDPNGHVSRFAYDSDGNLSSATDPLSHTTTYSYDLIGRRLTTVSPRGNVAGANAISYTQTMTYDAFGDTTAITDGLGHVTSYQYDANRNLTAVTDANLHTTRYGYDLDNERTSVTGPDGGVVSTLYDGDGNVISQTDPLSGTTLVGYDALNRPISSTDPLRRTALVVYDPAGNVISTTNALAGTTLFGYDADNERTSVTRPDGGVLRVAYDPNGRVISSTDALTQTTLYAYDALDRLISSTDPLTRTSVYSYDLADNRIALTDPMSRSTQFGYDADHELTAITYSDGTTPNVAYTYTPSGRRQTMTDGTGTSTYQYDALDRVITSTNGAGQTVGYRYDLAGNLSNLIYPDGSVITRTYDAANRLTGLTDWAGRTIGYSYDAADRLVQQTYPTTSPLTTTLGYNNADQLTYMVDSVVTGTLWAFGDSRDKLGHLNGVSDPLDGPTHFYGYNALNQLTADVQGNGVVTTTTGWGVDAAAAITQSLNLSTASAPATTTLGYDAAHELTSLNVAGTSPLTYTYGYNGDGDRVSVTNVTSGASTAYGWDQADRLVTATTPSGPASYAYNGDGLRQSKTVSGTTEAYTWDTAEGQPLLLQDGTVRYIDGPDGLPIEEVSGSTVLYFLSDQLGSTRGLVTNGGQVAASYSYTPYGSVKAHSGAFYTPFLYAGQYTDGETGFQYLQARYYDPATSQFLSVDPLVQQTGQPYAYVSANPLNATDPTGMDCSFWALVQGQCRWPTWKEVQATWQNEVRPETYSAAVSTAGFFDSLTFGQFSKLANAAGAHVAICSADYQLGQAVGLPYNLAFAVVTEGGDVAADAASVRETTLVIGRVKDLLAPGALQPGEFTLLPKLTPDLGDPALNWTRNSSMLRLAIRNGVRQIRDASPKFAYRPGQGGAFLNAERNLLKNLGWTYDDTTHIWSAPK